MRSPFPGMDPFIEACGRWEDFHAKLIGALEQSIAVLVPERYLVRIGERYYVILSVGSVEQGHEAAVDVGVRTRQGAREPADAARGAVEGAAQAVAEAPVTMRAFVERRFRETFLEIRQTEGNRLVTVIEVLSPTNKRPGSDGWKLYRRKRQACLEDDSLNLVELDLLLGGRRQPMEDPWPSSPYYVLLKRQGQGNLCKVWPAFALRPLPKVPIPLLPPEADVQLELQPLVDAIYERSKYAMELDYRSRCKPPLAPDETERLARHGTGGTGPGGPA
ncbi:MAG: DUF4058 family protein [Planctomycetes bacterium]|nr:DUF4058 family protein [Planctomycetota bacterium]